MAIGKNKKSAKSTNGNGTYERKDMSGSLFDNDRKEKESQPDMTGVVKIFGKELRVAAWVKERSGGEDWLSLSFSEFQKDEDEAPAKKSFKKKPVKREEEDEDEDEEVETETDDSDEEEDDDDADEEEIAPPKKGTTRKTAKK